MAEARKIQCPSCGSNSTFKLPDGNYKCNYCQSNFVLDNHSDPGNFDRIIINSVNASSSAPTKTNRKSILYIAIGLFTMMSMGAGFFLFKTASSPGILKQPVSQSQRSVIEMTNAFVGSEGAVIWIIEGHKFDADSVWYEIFAVDPLTNLVKGRQVFIKAFKANTNLAFSKKVGYQFWLFGDTAYTISDENGLAGYNIYSGLEEVNSKILSQKFPEFKDGILKSEYLSSEHLFKIATTNGDLFKFDPLSQTVFYKKEGRAKKKLEEPVTTDLYLTDGLKHQLYKLTKRGEGFPLVANGFLQESRIPQLVNSKAKVEDIFGNKSIEKVSDKNYFRAQSLIRGEDQSLVVLYKTSLSDNAEVVLESVNAEGSTNWTLKDPLFASVQKAFASEDLGVEYSYSKDLLILKLSPEGPEYMGIDIRTGKVLWRFNPKTYATEKGL